jgi:ligand-binding SRPBCC domain-containing protein
VRFSNEASLLAIYMKIKISTSVGQDYKTVFSKFDVDLFKKLKPKFTAIKVLRFDGCQKGDEVHVELNILGFKKTWKALITENNADENEIYFVDEGLQLPKPLKKWRHEHKIVKFIDNSIIIDNIAYYTSNALLDILFYPILYLQFYLRKSVYKSYFGK